MPLWGAVSPCLPALSAASGCWAAAAGRGVDLLACKPLRYSSLSCIQKPRGYQSEAMKKTTRTGDNKALHIKKRIAKVVSVPFVSKGQALRVLPFGRSLDRQSPRPKYEAVFFALVRKIEGARPNQHPSDEKPTLKSRLFFFNELNKKLFSE